MVPIDQFSLPSGLSIAELWPAVAAQTQRWLSSRGVLVSVAFLCATLGVMLASSGHPPNQTVFVLAWIVVAVGQCAGAQPG